MNAIVSPYTPPAVADEPTLWWAVGQREAGGALTVRNWCHTEREAVNHFGWHGAGIWRITAHSEVQRWQWSRAGCWVWCEPA